MMLNDCLCLKSEIIDEDYREKRSEYLFYANAKKVDKQAFLTTNSVADFSTFHNFAFSINGAYAIYDSQLLAWIPQSQNLYDDNLEYLSSPPISFSNFGSKKIVKISCNAEVVHAITEDSIVFSWGNDSKSQGLLALGEIFSVKSPTHNKHLSSIRTIDISLSENHGAAIDSCRNLFTWGNGSIGQLGNKNIKSALLPRKVLLNVPFNVIKVECGNNYTCGITIDKTVFFFGRIQPSIACYTNDIPIPGTISESIIRRKDITFLPLNIQAEDIYCGEKLFAITSSVGGLYVYIEDQGLYRVKIPHKINKVKFISDNFYAMNPSNDILYEFINYSNSRRVNMNMNEVSGFDAFGANQLDLHEYVENSYKINKKARLKMLQSPFYVKALFFTLCCSIEEKEKYENSQSEIFIKNKHQGSNQQGNDITILNDTKANEHNSSITSLLNKTNQTNKSRVGKISSMLGNIFEKKIETIRNANKSIYNCNSSKEERKNMFMYGKKRIEVIKVDDELVDNDSILSDSINILKRKQMHFDNQTLSLGQGLIGKCIEGKEGGEFNDDFPSNTLQYNNSNTIYFLDTLPIEVDSKTYNQQLHLNLNDTQSGNLFDSWRNPSQNSRRQTYSNQPPNTNRFRSQNHASNLYQHGFKDESFDYKEPLTEDRINKKRESYSYGIKDKKTIPLSTINHRDHDSVEMINEQRKSLQNRNQRTITQNDNKEGNQSSNDMNALQNKIENMIMRKKETNKPVIALPISFSKTNNLSVMRYDDKGDKDKAVNKNNEINNTLNEVVKSTGKEEPIKKHKKEVLAYSIKDNGMKGTLSDNNTNINNQTNTLKLDEISLDEDKTIQVNNKTVIINPHIKQKEPLPIDDHKKDDNKKKDNKKEDNKKEGNKSQEAINYDIDKKGDKGFKRQCKLQKEIDDQQQQQESIHDDKSKSIVLKSNAKTKKNKSNNNKNIVSHNNISNSDDQSGSKEKSTKELLNGDDKPLVINQEVVTDLIKGNPIIDLNTNKTYEIPLVNNKNNEKETTRTDKINENDSNLMNTIPVHDNQLKQIASLQLNKENEDNNNDYPNNSNNENDVQRNGLNIINQKANASHDNNNNDEEILNKESSLRNKDSEDNNKINNTGHESENNNTNNRTLVKHNTKHISHEDLIDNKELTQNNNDDKESIHNENDIETNTNRNKQINNNSIETKDNEIMSDSIERKKLDKVNTSHIKKPEDFQSHEKTNNNSQLTLKITNQQEKEPDNKPNCNVHENNDPMNEVYNTNQRQNKLISFQEEKIFEPTDQNENNPNVISSESRQYNNKDILESSTIKKNAVHKDKELLLMSQQTILVNNMINPRESDINQSNGKVNDLIEKANLRNCKPDKDSISPSEKDIERTIDQNNNYSHNKGKDNNIKDQLGYNTKLSQDNMINKVYNEEEIKHNTEIDQQSENNEEKEMIGNKAVKTLNFNNTKSQMDNDENKSIESTLKSDYDGEILTKSKIYQKKVMTSNNYKKDNENGNIDDIVINNYDKHKNQQNTIYSQSQISNMNDIKDKNKIEDLTTTSLSNTNIKGKVIKSETLTNHEQNKISTIKEKIIPNNTTPNQHISIEIDETSSLNTLEVNNDYIQKSKAIGSVLTQGNTVPNEDLSKDYISNTINTNNRLNFKSLKSEENQHDNDDCNTIQKTDNIMKKDQLNNNKEELDQIDNDNDNDKSNENSENHSEIKNIRQDKDIVILNKRSNDINNRNDIDMKEYNQRQDNNNVDGKLTNDIEENNNDNNLKTKTNNTNHDLNNNSLSYNKAISNIIIKDEGEVNQAISKQTDQLKNTSILNNQTNPHSNDAKIHAQNNNNETNNNNPKSTIDEDNHEIIKTSNDIIIKSNDAISNNETEHLDSDPLYQSKVKGQVIIKDHKNIDKDSYNEPNIITEKGIDHHDKTSNILLKQENNLLNQDHKKEKNYDFPRQTNSKTNEVKKTNSHNNHSYNNDQQKNDQISMEKTSHNKSHDSFTENNIVPLSITKRKDNPQRNNNYPESHFDQESPIDFRPIKEENIITKQLSHKPKQNINQDFYTTDAKENISYTIPKNLSQTSLINSTDSDHINDLIGEIIKTNQPTTTKNQHPSIKNIQTNLINPKGRSHTKSLQENSTLKTNNDIENLKSKGTQQELNKNKERHSDKTQSNKNVKGNDRSDSNPKEETNVKSKTSRVSNITSKEGNNGKNEGNILSTGVNSKNKLPNAVSVFHTSSGTTTIYKKNEQENVNKINDGKTSKEKQDKTNKIKKISITSEVHNNNEEDDNNKEIPSEERSIQNQPTSSINSIQNTKYKSSCYSINNRKQMPLTKDTKSVKTLHSKIKEKNIIPKETKAKTQNVSLDQHKKDDINNKKYKNMNINDDENNDSDYENYQKQNLKSQKNKPIKTSLQNYQKNSNKEANGNNKEEYHGRNAKSKSYQNTSEDYHSASDHYYTIGENDSNKNNKEDQLNPNTNKASKNTKKKQDIDKFKELFHKTNKNTSNNDNNVNKGTEHNPITNDLIKESLTNREESPMKHQMISSSNFMQHIKKIDDSSSKKAEFIPKELESISINKDSSLFNSGQYIKSSTVTSNENPIITSKNRSQSSLVSSKAKEKKLQQQMKFEDLLESEEIYDPNEGDRYEDTDQYRIATNKTQELTSSMHAKPLSNPTQTNPHQHEVIRLKNKGELLSILQRNDYPDEESVYYLIEDEDNLSNIQEEEEAHEYSPKKNSQIIKVKNKKVISVKHSDQVKLVHEYPHEKESIVNPPTDRIHYKKMNSSQESKNQNQRLIRINSTKRGSHNQKKKTEIDNQSREENFVSNSNMNSHESDQFIKTKSSQLFNVANKNKGNNVFETSHTLPPVQDTMSQPHLTKLSHMSYLMNPGVSNGNKETMRHFNSQVKFKKAKSNVITTANTYRNKRTNLIDKVKKQYLTTAEDKEKDSNSALFQTMGNAHHHPTLKDQQSHHHQSNANHINYHPTQTLPSSNAAKSSHNNTNTITNSNKKKTNFNQSRANNTLKSPKSTQKITSSHHNQFNLLNPNTKEISSGRKGKVNYTARSSNHQTPSFSGGNNNRQKSYTKIIHPFDYNNTNTINQFEYKMTQAKEEEDIAFDAIRDKYMDFLEKVGKKSSFIDNGTVDEVFLRNLAKNQVPIEENNLDSMQCSSDMRQFIIHSLENFKLKQVREKLDVMREKAQNSNNIELAKSNLLGLIEIDYEDELKDKSNMFEPMELDKSWISLNFRKSFVESMKSSSNDVFQDHTSLRTVKAVNVQLFQHDLNKIS